ARQHALLEAPRLGQVFAHAPVLLLEDAEGRAELGVGLARALVGRREARRVLLDLHDALLQRREGPRRDRGLLPELLAQEAILLGERRDPRAVVPAAAPRTLPNTSAVRVVLTARRL